MGSSEYIRTDLAAESATAVHNAKGVCFSEYEREGLRISTLEVSGREGEEASGKPAGRYITVYTGKIWYCGEAELERAAGVIADCLRELAEGIGAALDDAVVVGLGNRSMTADALGPLTADGIAVTRHIKELEPALYESLAKTTVCALTPGVSGQTGIETLEVIRGVIARVKPRICILVDALAARSTGRLATTVQLSDGGISPGSGVGNRREAIDRNSVGVPVITVGVPMVVDSSTLVWDVLERAGIEEVSDNLRQELENGRSFFVTLRDGDAAVSACAKLLAKAFNRAFGNDDLI